MGKEPKLIKNINVNFLLLMFPGSYMLCIYCIRYKFMVVSVFIAINVKHQKYYFGSDWFIKVYLNTFFELIWADNMCILRIILSQLK